MTPLESLLARWRADAETLRRRGAVAQGDALTTAADELAGALQETALEALDLTVAAAESGYSPAQLRRLIRAGSLPNVGRAHAPRVRRGDLPKKATPRPYTVEGPTLARLVLATGAPRRSVP